MQHEIQEHITLTNWLLTQQNELTSIFEICLEAILQNKKIIIAGNGGSAADAQHLASELTGRFEKNRRALSAIALTTDTSAITAIGNDYGFEFIFSRQIEALAQEGDVFIGISTSGNSKNIVKAISQANAQRVHTIGLLGNNGGELKEIATNKIIIPSNNTARIQEMHIVIIHLLCKYIEESI